MNLAWLTDTHLNFIDAPARQRFYQDIVDSASDGVLLSGDIAEAPSVKDVLVEMVSFIDKPVYFVLGNHDYYRGCVSAVRQEMILLTQTHAQLFWLPASGPLQLDNHTYLVGQDGWADGRLGNYHDSQVVLNDSRMIADLFQEAAMGRSQLLTKMRQLADDDAEALRAQLLQVVRTHPKKVIVLTHVPPFKEVSFHQGKINDEDWLPYFTSKATGDVLHAICTTYPTIHFWVLCGHTHEQASYSPLPNMLVEAGHVEYNRPEVQKIISVNEIASGRRPSQ